MPGPVDHCYPPPAGNKAGNWMPPSFRPQNEVELATFILWCGSKTFRLAPYASMPGALPFLAVRQWDSTADAASDGVPLIKLPQCQFVPMIPFCIPIGLCDGPAAWPAQVPSAYDVRCGHANPVCCHAY